MNSRRSSLRRGPPGRRIWKSADLPKANIPSLTFTFFLLDIRRRLDLVIISRIPTRFSVLGFAPQSSGCRFECAIA